MNEETIMLAVTIFLIFCFISIAWFAAGAMWARYRIAKYFKDLADRLRELS